MSEQFLYFLQQMFNGVTLGSTYALIAIGYTMVYGIIGMINFAHGEVYMIGSYVSFMIIAALMMMGIDTGWLLVAAGFVGAIVIASAYGWSIERVAYRPVRNSKRLIALISAIGMSIFLQNYVSLTEGSRDVALPSLFNGQWVVGHSENFSASITTMQAVIWIVTFLAMLALTIFIRYSRMGRACRACAEDLKMASLLGINTDRVIALTFVIGAAMAAVAGVLLGQFYGVINPYIGFMAGMKAFTAAATGRKITVSGTRTCLPTICRFHVTTAKIRLVLKSARAVRCINVKMVLLWSMKMCALAAATAIWLARMAHRNITKRKAI